MLEAKSASALNHPNIITIYEIGETDETNFIATEFIEGQTLKNCESWSLRATLKVATQIASALQATHNEGIVHRDIKPEIVMIRPDGLVKILDFGIARLSELTITGVHRKENNLEALTAVKAGAGTARDCRRNSTIGIKWRERQDHRCLASWFG